MDKSNFYRKIISNDGVCKKVEWCGNGCPYLSYSSCTFREIVFDGVSDRSIENSKKLSIEYCKSKLLQIDRCKKLRRICG